MVINKSPSKTITTITSGKLILMWLYLSFFLFSNETYVVGTQKNRLNESVLLKTTSYVYDCRYDIYLRQYTVLSVALNDLIKEQRNEGMHLYQQSAGLYKCLFHLVKRSFRSYLKMHVLQQYSLNPFHVALNISDYNPVQEAYRSLIDAKQLLLRFRKYLIETI